ncbi:hypothetical protein SERLADRAFT_404787 [Serpula lacrymans var. lacrymans S7.9]|uniref:Uncharacterized protein n=1 Tax=Serpula lacrymans var. lacrymans (strain S7.9) TaxID=578457 RepID=F8NF01_SERL9|nr:uncharacterized protein SERLADRAFT_404787 [Serpula lacrymans var. lacrymans S7.9]EGO30760.1 hypothetical protein SERLADRAFT_404787 [Serpula lacrymans var. lacrymans S7.9]
MAQVNNFVQSSNLIQSSNIVNKAQKAIIRHTWYNETYDQARSDMFGPFRHDHHCWYQDSLIGVLSLDVQAMLSYQANLGQIIWFGSWSGYGTDCAYIISKLSVHLYDPTYCFIFEMLWIDMTYVKGCVAHSNCYAFASSHEVNCSKVIDYYTATYLHLHKQAVLFCYTQSSELASQVILMASSNQRSVVLPSFARSCTHHICYAIYGAKK